MWKLLKQSIGRRTDRLRKRVSRAATDPFITQHLRGLEGRLLNVGCGLKSYAYLIHGGEVRVDVKNYRPAVQADVHCLPFQPNVFDAVLMEELLEHCERPWVAVREVHRTLRPGGLLLLTTRFMFPLHDAPNDYYRFTAYGLRHLLDGMFEPCEVMPDTSGYGTLVVLFQRLALEGGVLRWLSPLIVGAGFLAHLLDPWVSRFFRLPSYASGYLVMGRKTPGGSVTEQALEHTGLQSQEDREPLGAPE